ncbi:hypothetical protein R0135_10120 [Congregibacter variabilis]|uniref:Uncharacterized protein n=1 Tax=Congregibacter variabilis TaxID=3081200 RepID=A0ABZ0HY23_9GAMM|nr:hypothetical protein R0135_10120 [Congregibacter sp. IMCC43200]
MVKRTLEEWASVGEIISAVAVVISLLYVGYQVNQNTDQMRAANRQQLVNRSLDATKGFAMNPEVARVLTKVENQVELNQEEQTQFSYVIRGVLYDVQEAFLLHAEGGLDEGYWGTRANLVKIYLQTPVARKLYLSNREQGVLHPRFTAWLDQALPRNEVL